MKSGTRGVVAAGSETTATAGGEILAAGGNAVDAAVAACLATAAGEPTLTSLAGGGVMLYRNGQTGKVTISDFFANAPGLGGEPQQKDFFSIELDFGPTVQSFHIGAASAAIPGVIPGLMEAHDRWGCLPLSQVVAPGCRAARQGQVLGIWQQRAAALLEGILLHSERGRAQFGRLDAAGKVHLMQEGDRYLCPGVADLLEAMAKEGWKKVYNGPFRQQMLTSAGLKAGGLLSERDFEAYEVYYRSPLTFAYRGASVHTTPPPGAGGEMIALMLALLETESLESFGSIEHRALLGRMMKVAEEARLAEAVTTQSYPRWKKRFAELAGKPLGSVEALPSGAGSTTHVTVLDGEGNACAVTFSYGEGNGYLIGDTNIMMNNLMGEEDLFPNGFFSWIPGERLSTMMSPTLVEAPDGALFVLGTGGANRIRTAITQAVSNLLDFEMDVHRATLAPRVHFEGGVFNAEVFESRASDKFDTLGPQEIVRFVEPNLFFGGVHLCCRKADGALDAAGDPRRGGAVAAV